MYVAHISTPGYLPDQPAEVFDTSQEAWAWLSEERKWAEDQFEEKDCAELVTRLQAMNGEGCIIGPTPGLNSTHDLGHAYVVERAER